MTSLNYKVSKIKTDQNQKRSSNPSRAIIRVSKMQ
jgi:hypothetical protein